MTDGSLNFIDIAVVSILVLSTLVGVLRGFIREMLSLAAWAIAGIVTLNFIDNANAIVSQSIESKPISYAVSGIGLFIIVLILCAILNAIIIKLVRIGGLAGVDRSAGLLFGILRGGFIVSLCFLAFTMVLAGDSEDIFKEAKYPKWLEEAHAFSGLKTGAEALADAAPGYVAEFSKMSETKKLAE